MIKDRYTISKKKKASIKLSAKAIPNQLSKKSKILKYIIFKKLSEIYKKKLIIIIYESFIFEFRVTFI